MHGIYRVSKINPEGAYRLRVSFDDGTQQSIDFLPVLKGPVFGPLRDPEVFGKAVIDPEVHTIVWPNGADFDPATLHDWPEVRDELIARARSWELTAA